MSINVACSRLRTQVSCSAVSVDGYDASNLISDNPRHRSAGFLAEAFVRPPVNITLLFPCSIDIHRVVVNGQVGGQRSVGFEVFTAVSPASSTSSDNNDDSIRSFNDGVFCCIGRCYSADKPLICFQNSSYTVRSRGGCALNNVSSTNDAVNEKLYHRMTKHLTSVRALALRVTRTVNGSTVAVRQLEVWGQPAVGTSADVLTSLFNVVGERTHGARASAETSAISRRRHDSSVVAADECQDATAETATVPSEFLDAVTLELMSVPILLPSGMSVDRSTLDRHNLNEASWGRLPNDPFTGRTFSSSSKPVVHSALKARIDRYLLENDRNSQVLGSKNSSGLSSSRLVTGRTAEVESAARFFDCLIDRTELAVSTRTGGEMLSSNVDSSSLTADACKTDDGGKVNQKRCNEDGQHEFSWPRKKLAVPSSVGDVVASSPSDRTRSESCLANGTPVLRLQSVLCDNCFCVDSRMMINLYRVTCKHHLCRQCLVGATTSTDARGASQQQRLCPVCRATFRSSDAVRVHY